MKKQLAALGAMLLMLTACNGFRTPRFDPALYPQTYPFYDLTLFWKVIRTGNAVDFEGFAKNTRFAYIEGLELTATLQDVSGKSLREATFFFIPNQIPLDNMEPFSLHLPVKQGEEPARVKFLYWYSVAEDGRSKKTYFNSFEEKLP